MSDMTAFLGAFDAANHETTQDYSVVPPGDYPVFVEAACIKQTKAGTGHFIEVVLQILDGQFKGRKIWDRINIDNPNQTAVEIGKKQLAALGQAIGLGVVTDTDQLINQCAYAVVKVKDNNNEVKTYINAAKAAERAAESGAAAAAQVQPPAAVPAAPPVPPPAPVQQAPPVQAPPAPVAQPPVQQPQQIPAPLATPQQQTAGAAPWER